MPSPGSSTLAGGVVRLFDGVETTGFFFPFKPHLLLILKLIGFFSFLSLLVSLILATVAILASISAFFLANMEA